MLAFLDYYAPINVDVFVECGMLEIFRLLPSCHNGSSLSVLIQLHYFCTPQKASVGMYSYLLFVYILFDLAIPTSFNFIQLFFVLVLFIVLSVIYECHLIITSVQCKIGSLMGGVKIRSHAPH